MSKFSFNIDTRVLLIDALVRGPIRSHVVKMILDTGASYTILSPEILIDIGHDPSQSTVRRAITTASGIEYAGFVSVLNIEALGKSVEALEICSHSLPPTIPARGLLGLNFLCNFNVHLNFLDGNIEIIS